MHMSTACPWGRPQGKPGEYVGEYKGRDWMNCFKFEGKRVGELQILEGNYGDITGIYRIKGFIKGEALRLLELRACLHWRWGTPGR